MSIIPAVAVVAARRRAHRDDIGLPVARLALKSPVGTGQGIACLLIVIEPPAGPTVGIVAGRAGAAEPAAVVRILVTGDARARGILERLRSMAFLAGYHGVQSYQRKPRQIMVESDFLAPAGFLVALRAVGAQLALVSIILAVTGHARRRQFVSIEVAGVTALAGDIGVAAAQGKPRRLVVVEANHGPTPGRVTGLAAIAALSRMLVLQAVA